MSISTIPEVYPFPGSREVQLSKVGGKGWSLIKMAEAGLPVPPGLVLPVDFFYPWIAELKSGPIWVRFLNAKDTELAAACADLKKAALKLAFSPEQAAALASIRKNHATESLFAVRSSSPEEDLEGSSFAGGYETILGVTLKSLEDGIRKAFASCLDYRIVVYKREHGFDTKNPSIAVVIQRQIASEIAGVGFSLNPLTNNYDEAVFNANWGLGETVVAGIATPDTYIVDKVTATVKSRVVGGKETSIWLKESGGTSESRDPRHAELALTDEQLLALSELTVQVEALYQKPTDIEWAFAGGELFLLQARPITTFVPLSPEMVSAPGERKRLYLDVTISVQGIYKPLSPMGTSVLTGFFKYAGKRIFGQDIIKTVETSVPWPSNGRLYLNLSNLFAIAGKEKFVQLINNMDPLAAEVLQQTDEQEYLPLHKESKHPPLHLLWQLPEVGLHILEARILPEHAHRRAEREIATYMHETRALAAKNLPVLDFVQAVIEHVIGTVFHTTLPLFVASRVALDRMKSIVGSKDEQAIAKLEKGLPNNITTEMGLALYHLAQLLPEDMKSKDLQEGLKHNSLPEAFQREWAEFLNLYGHRGPVELDIASSRYRDDPKMLMDQLLMLRNSATDSDNPQDRFDRAQQERHQHYELLCSELHDRGWLQVKHFQSLYKVFETLSGYREVHKYCLIFGIDLVRQRLQSEANTLCKAGRLDKPEQIFDLSLENLGQGLKDQNFDLRQAGKRNREFPDRLARVPKLPAIIDSRGLIRRPAPRPAREGEVAGTPISAGIARGRVKVLHAPDEKPLERGEILVARATDPGWTPLFVNAAAVILEVGGMLQHGALVAREYGLPCVSGIPEATTLWPDGTEIEVDGSTGIIKVLSTPGK
jgi:pyruvate,water dikinase